MRLLIATTNPGKIREFRQMLAAAGGIQFSDLTEHRNLPAVEETGRTFLANASLKATEYATALNTWALADDSGLAVDALDGKPGVYSARWAEMHEAGKGDADNNALLIRQLAQVPVERRTARFICALALADSQGRVILTASSSVEGRILTSPRGGGGFGYDPLFLVDALGKTTGELPADEKHQISHRGQALRRLRLLMERTGLMA
ncbi:MAG TPA: RdgB/HAM1 family non-canonical purine NTP pyrophosphatase [Tepidisphaeraceae bacterium]|nr:RdgB/HAM1 family non-canonical purine NTP pyrophosphatase [Tepidisphaeraceae bacterium]